MTKRNRFVVRFDGDEFTVFDTKTDRQVCAFGRKSDARDEAKFRNNDAKEMEQ